MSKSAPHKPQRIGALSVALKAVGAPVQLFPAGTFDAPRGAMMGEGPWRVTPESAEKLIASVSARQNDMLVDYEHQSLLAAKNGQPAPAAGWITPASLAYDERGLFATAVKWTPAAQGYIEADEYRYISPVFYYEADTGVVTDLISVALTNTPAIDGMDQVALAAAGRLLSANTTPEDSLMDELKERLLYLLNLPVTSTNEEIAAQLDKLKAMITGDGDMAATSLIGLIDSKDAAIAALSAAAPDPAQFAPIAALTAANEELAALRSEKAALELEILLAPAIADGRLAGEKLQKARELGATSLDALKMALEVIQPIAALSGTQTGGRAPVASGNTEFKAPSGFTADAKAAASHSRIMAYCKQHNTDYLTAALALEKQS